MLQKSIVSVIVSLFCWSFSFAQTNADSLIVFVGEKIEVRNVPFKNPVLTKTLEGKDSVEKATYVMDNKYLAKYRIIQLLNGKYKADTIEFIAWDHYGLPAFANYKNVLLYVYPHREGLIHEKYQYQPVYLTKTNKWAGPYDSGDSERAEIEPEPIDFKEAVITDISKLKSRAIKIWYPRPYYKIVKKKAFAIYGNYVDDLFKIKQEGVLNARGFY